MIEMLNKQQAMCLRCQKIKSDLNLQGRKVQIIYTKLECELLRESNCYLRRELRQLCKRSEDYINLFKHQGTLYMLSEDESDEMPHRVKDGTD